MDVVPETADRREGYDEINKTRDYIAEQGLSWLAEDVITSEVQAVTQHGIGKITGAAATSVSETFSFPVPFASVPVMHVSYIGARTTSTFNPAGLSDFAPDAVGKGFGPSTSGATALVHRTNGANLSAGWDFYYSWSATGVLA